VFFEIIGNLFLSKYILEQTVTHTIKYNEIFKNPEFTSLGILSLGSVLVLLLLSLYLHMIDDLCLDYDECDDIRVANVLDPHHVQWARWCLSLRLLEL
jgi:hypothetical protein